MISLRNSWTLQILMAGALGGSLAMAAETSTPQSNPWAEHFDSPPAQRAWYSVGETSLFEWDSSTESLKVTWDSAQTNSFFCRDLETVLTTSDDFSLSFDLRLGEIFGGINPARPSTFQMALGLLDRAEAFRASFLRGSGVHRDTGARSVLEWNYFPDTGFGATVSPIIFDTQNTPAAGFTFPVELVPGPTYRIRLEFIAAQRVLRTAMTSNGVPMIPIASVTVPQDFDFRLDTVAVCSYSDAGQPDPEYAGSILARGWVDDVVLVLPPLLRIQFLESAPPSRRLGFFARARWQYILERSTNLKDWTSLVQVRLEFSGNAELEDPKPPADGAFYRVLAGLIP